MHRTSVLIAATVLLCAGCSVSPAPVYRAQPAEGTGFWTAGAELARCTNDSIEVVVAFSEWTDGWLAFHVEFLNRSERNLTLDPATIHLVPVEPRDGEDRVSARDPEQAILGSDLARSRARAREQSRTDTNLLFDFLEFGAELASTGEEQSEAERQTEVLEEQEEELDDAIQAQEHEKALRSIDAGRNRWADDALRKTTVPPGFCIGGKTWFRARGESRTVMFVVPVGEDSVRIPFEIVRHEAD